MARGVEIILGSRWKRLDSSCKIQGGKSTQRGDRPAQFGDDELPQPVIRLVVNLIALGKVTDLDGDFSCCHSDIALSSDLLFRFSLFTIDIKSAEKSSCFGSMPSASWQ